jgi:hypothetical protein
MSDRAPGRPNDATASRLRRPPRDVISGPSGSRPSRLRSGTAPASPGTPPAGHRRAGRSPGSPTPPPVGGSGWWSRSASTAVAARCSPDAAPATGRDDPFRQLRQQRSPSRHRSGTSPISRCVPLGHQLPGHQHRQGQVCRKDHRVHHRQPIRWLSMHTINTTSRTTAMTQWMATALMRSFTVPGSLWSGPRPAEHSSHRDRRATAGSPPSRFKCSTVRRLADRGTVRRWRRGAACRTSSGRVAGPQRGLLLEGS